MLDKNYALLLQYLEEIISSDTQITHGKNSIQWEETKIPELIQYIRRQQESYEAELLEPGDSLQNKFTGQQAVVCYVDDCYVHLNTKVLVYPKKYIWQHFKRYILESP